MRFAFPRFSRPPIGTPLDASSQLQRGLIYFAPFWGEGNAKLVRDIVNRNDAGTVAGTPVWSPGLAGSVNSGLSLASSASIKSGTIPAGQQSQLVWPMTIAFGATVTAEVGATSIFGLYSGSAFCISIAGATTSGIGYLYLNGSSQVTHNVSNNITLGTNVVAGLTVTPSSQALYLNGNLNFSASNAASNPTLGSPVWFIGGGATANVVFYWAAAWNRADSATEHQAVATNIWQIFSPRYAAGVFGGQPFGLPHISILRPISDRSGSRRMIWAE